MIGSVVDQQIFEDLMREHFSPIMQHLEENNLPISTITSPWFLCFFIGYIPLEVSYNFEL